jgi:hypothetical protein
MGGPSEAPREGKHGWQEFNLPEKTERLQADLLGQLLHHSSCLLAQQLQKHVSQT